MKKQNQKLMKMISICVALILVGSVALFANQNGANIGEEKAKTIALEHAGIKERDTSFIRVTLDYDRGIAEYDVEFWVGNTEYDYEINATTGAIKSFDYDAEYQHRANGAQPSQNAASFIGEEKAREIALQHAGVKDVTRFRIKLDYDDGFAEYEIEWRVGRKDYEYTISATTGDIIEFDVDDDGWF